MCGIAGLFGSGLPQPRQAIQRMTDRLAHRGPDDQGTFVDDTAPETTVALGHTRLSIVDLSANGHQPMHSRDGRYVIVFNGEVYNYRSIRDILTDRGFEFTSDTDTEVILNAYIAWGKDCLHRFNGMFAFAIFDRRERSLFLARDRMGIKPLYVTTTDAGAVLFASEVRALLQSGAVPPRLNRRILPLYLKYQTVPSPDTLLDGVEMLMPGHWMTVGADGVETQPYWHLLGDANQEAAGHDAGRIRHEIRERLMAAVDRRMLADVPVGAFLSGGIDSSLIVGLMSRLCHRPVDTFTVAFQGTNLKDGAYAAKVAKRFNTRHHEIKLSYVDVLHQIDRALVGQDHPSADGVNTFLVSYAVKRAGLTVALSGEGGDELFVGYGFYDHLIRQQRARMLWRVTPRPLRKGLGTMLHAVAPSILTQKLQGMMASDGSLAEVYAVSRQSFGAAQTAALLADPPSAADPYAALLRPAPAGDERLFARLAYAEARSYMHDVLLRDADQMSMAHALEVRVPFLDHQLVEYVMGVPDHHKAPNGMPKRLLVEAFDDILPAEVVNRPKQGFEMPFDTWMRGPLRALCLDNLEVLADSPAFQAPVIHRYWEAFRKGKRVVSWSRLWLLVTLGAWIRAHNATS